MTVYFLTTNEYKVEEALDYAAWRQLATRYALQLSIVKYDIQELLNPDVTVIVRNKAVNAYAYMRHPCLVEHGGLFMDALPGLPGGVGKIVWNAVGDRMCGFLRESDSRAATARSVLGYCDGRRVRVYEGETRGQIATGARGDYKFAWDPIFMPAQSDVTYGEMAREQKRESSPFIKALDRFIDGERAHFRLT